MQRERERESGEVLLHGDLPKIYYYVRVLYVRTHVWMMHHFFLNFFSSGLCSKPERETWLSRWQHERRRQRFRVHVWALRLQQRGVQRRSFHRGQSRFTCRYVLRTRSYTSNYAKKTSSKTAGGPVCLIRHAAFLSCLHACIVGSIASGSSPFIPSRTSHRRCNPQKIPKSTTRNHRSD